MKPLKQIELARDAGVTRGFISRILNSEDPLKPSWETAKKLALASETDPVWWVEKNLDKLLPLFNPEKIKSALMGVNKGTTA